MKENQVLRVCVCECGMCGLLGTEPKESYRINMPLLLSNLLISLTPQSNDLKKMWMEITSTKAKHWKILFFSFLPFALFCISGGSLSPISSPLPPFYLSLVSLTPFPPLGPAVYKANDLPTIVYHLSGSEIFLGYQESNSASWHARKCWSSWTLSPAWKQSFSCFIKGSL